MLLDGFILPIYMDNPGYNVVVVWPWLDARCPPKLFSLPLLNWTGEKKYDERLMGCDKGEITHQLLSQAKQT